MKNTKRLMIASALIGATILMAGCEAADEAKVTNDAAPATQSTAPVEPAESAVPASEPAVVEQESNEVTAIADDPDHKVTSLTDPGAAELTEYRKLESPDDYALVFYGLADFDIPVTTRMASGNYNNKHAREMYDVRSDYSYAHQTFEKMDLEERHAELVSKLKDEAGGKTLVKFEVSARDAFEPMLKSFDMDTKSFPNNFPGMNEGNVVDNFLIFSDNAEVAVINTGKISPIVIDDLVKARKIEADRNDISMTFYGAVSRLELVKHREHSILLVPHRIDVVNLNNKELIHSYEF